METLEELKAIIENAPEGAKYQALSEARKFYFDSVPDVDGCDMWIVSESGDAEKTDMDSVCICGFDEFRSLSDIKRIIELMEINAETQKKRASSSEAYGKFIDNMGRDHKLDLMLSNSIVNKCINLGHVSGMSEVETLKSAIAAMIKLSDDDLKNKIDLAMRRVNPYSKGAL